MLNKVLGSLTQTSEKSNQAKSQKIKTKLHFPELVSESVVVDKLAAVPFRCS